MSEETDVAITSAPLDRPALEVREIGRWTLLCALPAAQPFDLAAALRQRLVVYSPEAPQTHLIDQWLEQHGIARQVGVEVRSDYAACAMAAAGAGIAFVADLSARAHRSEGLVFLAVPGAPQFPIYSVSNVNRPLSQLGQGFMTSAEKELHALQVAALG